MIRVYVPTLVLIFALVSTNEACISLAKLAPSSEATFLKLLTSDESDGFRRRLR